MRDSVKRGENLVPKYNFNNCCLKESRSLPCVCLCESVQICVCMENLWSISYMEEMKGRLLFEGNLILIFKDCTIYWEKLNKKFLEFIKLLGTF